MKTRGRRHSRASREIHVSLTNALLHEVGPDHGLIESARDSAWPRHTVAAEQTEAPRRSHADRDSTVIIHCKRKISSDRKKPNGSEFESNNY